MTPCCVPIENGKWHVARGTWCVWTGCLHTVKLLNFCFQLHEFGSIQVNSFLRILFVQEGGGCCSMSYEYRGTGRINGMWVIGSSPTMLLRRH